MTGDLRGGCGRDELRGIAVTVTSERLGDDLLSLEPHTIQNLKVLAHFRNEILQ